VIGWTWLVFAGYLLFRSLLDLVAWRLLAPVRPALLAAFSDLAPGLGRLSSLFSYLPVFHSLKALFAAAAVIAAWRSLALPEWARLAMQVACGIELAYVLCFAAVWTWLGPRVAAARAHDPKFAGRSYGPIGLIAGIGICAVLGGALAAQILLLRSERLHAAFASARGGTTP
jgi:hypothetical protein